MFFCKNEKPHNCDAPSGVKFDVVVATFQLRFVSCFQHTAPWGKRQKKSRWTTTRVYFQRDFRFQYHFNTNYCGMTFYSSTKVTLVDSKRNNKRLVYIFVWKFSFELCGKYFVCTRSCII